MVSTRAHAYEEGGTANVSHNGKPTGRNRKSSISVKPAPEADEAASSGMDEPQPKKTKVEKKDDGNTENTNKRGSQKPASKTGKPADGEHETLERGIVYFFFRPKVDSPHPTNLDDVKTSYLILRPLPPSSGVTTKNVNQGGHSHDRLRIVHLPKKKLPKKPGTDRFIAFISEANSSPENVKKILSEDTYMTKTKGDRVIQAARPIAEGVYTIVKRTGDMSSHFIYLLTVPDELSKLHSEFGLAEQGKFIISVRNPEFPPPRQTAHLKGPSYPKSLTEKMEGYRWVPATSELLDYDWTQMLFIGERGDWKSFDRETTAELEGMEGEDEKRVDNLAKHHEDAVFQDLHLSKKEFEEKPLKGIWA